VDAARGEWLGREVDRDGGCSKGIVLETQPCPNYVFEMCEQSNA